MITRVRQWLVWVFEGGPAVAGERTFPALVTAFPEAAEATFSDLSYWSALVSLLIPASTFISNSLHAWYHNCVQCSNVVIASLCASAHQDSLFQVTETPSLADSSLAYSVHYLWPYPSGSPHPDR